MKIQLDARTGLDYLAESVRTTPEGNRNHMLLWAAMRAVEEDYPNADIVKSLTQAARDAGLTSTETAATIRSGIRRAERQGKRGSHVEGHERDLGAEYEAWRHDPAAQAEYAAAMADAEAEDAYADSGSSPPDDDDEAVTLSEFLSEKMDPPAWIVADLIPKGPAVGGLFGAEKAGKSLAGLQLCFVVALGYDFLGFKVENAGPTLFVEYEGSRTALQKRASTMALKYGAVGRPVPLELVHRPKVKIDTDRGEAWLTRRCRGKVLCIIGPVSKAANMVKENDPAEWQRLSERLQRVADATGCTILLVHHTRKPDRAMGAPSKVADFFNSTRGSNAYNGAVDVALGVQRDPESTEGVLFYLERDGGAGRVPYDWEVASLCAWPIDRPLRKPTAEDRAALVLDYIEAHPGCTRKDIGAGLGILEETLKGYLDMLAPKLTIAPEGPRRALTYRLTETS